MLTDILPRLAGANFFQPAERAMMLDVLEEAGLERAAAVLRLAEALMRGLPHQGPVEWLWSLFLCHPMHVSGAAQKLVSSTLDATREKGQSADLLRGLVNVTLEWLYPEHPEEIGLWNAPE